MLILDYDYTNSFIFPYLLRQNSKYQMNEEVFSESCMKPLTWWKKNHFVCLSLTNTELKNFSYCSCTIKNIHAGLTLRDKATSWNSKLGCSKMVPHRWCFACFCEVITSWKIQLMITTFSYSKFFWHYTTILNMYNLLKPVIIHLSHIILESTIKDFLGNKGGFTELRRPFTNLWKAHQQVVT